MFEKYDLIVVGAGHAGCEAAAAAANMGSMVLLITMNMGTIAQMSCNPAMGGIAKGQIIREIDALGGYSGLVSDSSAIQFRMLNKSKGPAVWSPRTQNDRWRFAEDWRLKLEGTPNVHFWQEMVSGLIVESGKVKGVKTSLGLNIYAKAVVLTNGTFLNGVIHLGEKQFGGGRAGESASKGITEELVALGFEHDRLKTGTPPRVDGRSLDYTKMEEQFGDESPGGFSFIGNGIDKNQHSCHITYTNPNVHDVLRGGFDRSPMFTGRIEGTGPRYCPSIEDKICRFSERDRHQIFVEPEGAKTVEVYVNGFSTSLPEDIQYKALRLIPGFENVRMFRPGYAIEYDFFFPTQLRDTLETKLVENLFFAGQINGTTGYEEAAAQGLMAGINAHLKINEKEKLVLGRSEAYIGVLIDDLVNKGTKEPYRMFTSRAEYRILLRQDNADDRLTERGYKIGLAASVRMKKLEKKRKDVEVVLNYLDKTSVDPTSVNSFLSEKGSAEIKQKLKLKELIKRPGIFLGDILTYVSGLEESEADILEICDILVKYEGYIKKEKEIADRMQGLDKVFLKESFDYSSLKSLSSEAREKLIKTKPENLGQASRISGVSPADISVLLVHLNK